MIKLKELLNEGNGDEAKLQVIGRNMIGNEKSKKKDSYQLINLGKWVVKNEFKGNLERAYKAASTGKSVKNGKVTDSSAEYYDIGYYADPSRTKRMSKKDIEKFGRTIVDRHYKGNIEKAYDVVVNQNGRNK